MRSSAARVPKRKNDVTSISCSDGLGACLVNATAFCCGRLNISSSESGGRIVQNNRPKSASTKLERKRPRIKQFGRLFSIYPVQSVHAPHSKQVNAARASCLAG